MRTLRAPAFDSSPKAQYIAAVERTEEMTRLLAQAHKRKSMLVFGPEGVGKTRLLRSFAKVQPLALYADQTQSPRDLMLALVENLRSLARLGLQLPADPKALSTSSLKGIVGRALDQHPFFLVLDQLSGPSRVVTGMIKEMNHYGRTPVIYAARTPHMEDIGTLLPICADRSERTELKNLALPIALEFAHREAEKMDICARNLEDALLSFVDWSEGNPGRILQMLKMALLSKYRIDNQIKAHVLYLDLRMGIANAQQFHA